MGVSKMSYLAENLKVLLWKGKGELSQRTYRQYLDFVALRCSLTPDHLRAILRDQEKATSDEERALCSYFSDYSDLLSAINYDFLFAELVEQSGEELLEKNIQYLLSTIGWGKNSEFVEKIGVNSSTLTRWKQGKTKPDKYAQSQIAHYFGFRDAQELRSKFLFLDFEPVSSEQKKQECKSLIDKMSKEDFELIFPALQKLLN